jgi:hypothetical protein
MPVQLAVQALKRRRWQGNRMGTAQEVLRNACCMQPKKMADVSLAAAALTAHTRHLRNLTAQIRNSGVRGPDWLQPSQTGSC